MNLESLLKFIKKEHLRLMKFYKIKDRKRLKHPITIKIMEEVGELSQKILASDGFQRKEKLAKMKGEVAHELIDVLITVLILAENMEIDVKKYLGRAIDKRQKRPY